MTVPGPDAILAAAPDAMIVTTPAGTISHVNEQAERLLGYTASELAGQPVELLVAERLREVHEHHRADYAAAPRRRHANTGLVLGARRRDGSEVPVEITLSPLADGSVIAALRDIPELERLAALAQEVRQQETLVTLGRAALTEVSLPDLYAMTARLVADAVDAPIVAFTEVADGRVRLLGAVGAPEDAPADTEAAWSGLVAGSGDQLVLGADDFAAHPSPVIRSVGGRCGVLTPFRTKRGFEGNLTAVRTEARPFTSQAQRFLAAATQLVATAVDIRRAREERDDLRAQVEQLRRIESLGMLAAAIAHDFSNLLGVIGNYARFALDGLPDGSPVREDVEHVREAVAQGRELTDRLLVYGRGEASPQERVDLGRLAAETVHMLSPSLGIDVRLEVEDGAGPVVADRVQVGQALANLLINARDAMPDGGAVSVTVRPCGDGGAELVVADEGPGMDAEMAGQAFEPFVSSKPGRGSGLGLATVQRAMSRAGGSVTLATEPGAGATFTLRFPSAVP